MSFLKKLGKIVNKVTDIGSGIVGYVPGVGPEIAGVLKAGGDLAGGHNLKNSLIAGLKTGGTAYAGGKLASLIKSGKLGSILGHGAGGMIDRNPGIDGTINGRSPGDYIGVASQGPGDPGTMPNVASSSGGGGGWLSKLGSVLGGSKPGGGTNWGGILGNVAKYGLPALGAYQASKTAGKADQYRQKAISLAEKNWADSAPLRTQGLSTLTDPRLTAITNVAPLFQPPPRNYRRISA